MGHPKNEIIKTTQPNRNLNLNEKYNGIFDKLYVPLCKYSLKLVCDISVAEDVVQECFVYLWENWQRLESIDSLQSYLFQSVKNRSINSLKNKFLASKEELTHEYSEKIFDLEPSAQLMMELSDLEQILEKALLELPEKCRTIFVLRRFENHSTKEVAELLQVSVKTVENQMTTAIKRMREYVIKHWDNSTLLLFNIYFSLK